MHAVCLTTNIFLFLVSFSSLQRVTTASIVNLFNSTDKLLHPLQSVGWNYLSIRKLQRVHRWSLGSIRWSLGMDKHFHLTYYWTCNYLSMLIWSLTYQMRTSRIILWKINGEWSKIGSRSQSDMDTWFFTNPSLRKTIFLVAFLYIAPSGS